MDYTPPPYGLYPPYYRPKFWMRKIEMSKRAEKLKNVVVGPPQAENFGVQNPLWTIPPLIIDQFLIRGGIVHKDCIDWVFDLEAFDQVCHSHLKLTIVVHQIH